mmetsp:Transcript_14678/g.12919  ORF Transcript_14678/g.12919 Transcript_14678/m.12919 type:complete len:312 (+) Transcript_14678:243-1178(+)
MIDNQYSILKVVGKGGSSKVFKVKDENDKVFAIKVIRKDKNFGYDPSIILQRETDLLQRLERHPNIINSISSNFEGMLTLEDQQESILYNVLEYASNGALSTFIRCTGGVEEELARPLSLQLCHAVEFIHNNGYGHLDIKLENILLDEFFNIKLADMGSSVNVINSGGYTDRRRGTQVYMAPEVTNLKSGQDFNSFSADIYSLGITLFVLLVGVFPNQNELDNISTDESEILDEVLFSNPLLKNQWKQLPANIRKLIIWMTDKDPAQRPTIQEVVNSEWLSSPMTKINMQNVYEEMYYRKSYMETEFKVKL